LRIKHAKVSLTVILLRKIIFQNDNFHICNLIELNYFSTSLIVVIITKEKVSSYNSAVLYASIQSSGLLKVCYTWLTDRMLLTWVHFFYCKLAVYWGWGVSAMKIIWKAGHLN